MKTLERISLALCIVFFLCCFSRCALANVPYAQKYVWGNDGKSCPSDTAQGVCDCSNALNPGVHQVAIGMRCVDQSHDNPIAIANTCPAGYTDTGVDCAEPQSCTAPKQMVNGQCVDPQTNCPTGNQVLAFQGRVGVGLQLGSANQCVGGCSYMLTDVVDIGNGNNCSDHADGTKTCFFKASGNGDHCSGSSTASAPNGGVNTGVTSTTTTNSSGTTQTTQSTTVNSNGSVTTTTTTTTTDANGNSSTSITSSTTAQSGVIPGNGGTGNGGSGTGTGTGKGAGSNDPGAGGDCDPDSKNYFDCQEVGNGPSHTTNQYQNGGDAFSNYETTMHSVPIVQAISSLRNAVSTANAQCPTPSFNAFGETFTIDMHCTLYDSVSGILSSVMLVVWSIRGVKIVASA